MSLSPELSAGLVAIVLIAFAAEAAIGFGATVITVTLAVQFVPLTVILPAFVPVNMLLSAYLAIRHRRRIALSVLLREVAPAVVIGLAIGLSIFRLQRSEVLALAFALFVVALSVVELRRPRAVRIASPLAPIPRSIMLGLGGVVHGLFGTGGPMIVYVLQRRGLDKGALRASLALIWLTLNCALITNFATLGLLHAGSARLSLLIALALLPALLIGEQLHRRLSPARFQLALFSLLLFAGLVLAARTTLKLASAP